MISADDLGLIYDSEGNTRHKDATFRAQVGEVFLGYFIFEDQAREAEESYEARFFREFDEIAREAEAYRLSLSEADGALNDAKKLVSELRMRLRVLERRSRKPLALYKSRLEEARRIFPHRESFKSAQ